jgi:hypothetical protein
MKKNRTTNQRFTPSLRTVALILFILFTVASGACGAEITAAELKKMATVAISAPARGVGGTLIIGSGSERAVVKVLGNYGGTPNPEKVTGVLFQQRLLSHLGIPTDLTTLFTRESKEFEPLRKFFEMRTSALPDNDPARNVSNRFKQTGDPTTILAMLFLESYKPQNSSLDIDSFALWERVPYNPATGAPLDRFLPAEIEAQQLEPQLAAAHALLSVIADKKQMQKLGSIAMADAFAGNGDRFFRRDQNGNKDPEWNWGNVLLGISSKAPKSPIVAAIDNSGEAPTLKVYRERCDAGKDAGEKEWVRAMIEGYFNTSNLRLPNLDDVANPALAANEITRNLKRNTLEMLERIAKLNPELTATGKNKKSDFTKDGQTWSLTLATAISVTSKGKLSIHYGKQASIDWKAVEAAIRSGLDATAQRIIDESDYEKGKFYKGKIGIILTKESKRCPDEAGIVSGLALILRANYLHDRLVAKLSHEQSIKQLSVAYLKFVNDPAYK